MPKEKAPAGTPKISFQLWDRKSEDERPLYELLAEAANVTNPDRGFGRTAREEQHERIWICKWAIRAVCEAIINAGCIPLPLAVLLCSKPKGGKLIKPILMTDEELMKQVKKLNTASSSDENIIRVEFGNN